MSLKYRAPAPPPKAQKVTAKERGSDFLVLIYAIAVGITPEFDFLGIPKVRVTDLLVPLILLTSSARRHQGNGPALPFTTLFMWMFCWDLGSLFIWGKAAVTPGIFYLAKRFVYFLTAYGVARSISNQRSWNRIVRILVFSSPLLAFTVLRELNNNLNSGTILAQGEYLRASGIIANQQTSTALYIAVITCLTLGSFQAFKDLAWKLGCIVSLLTGCAAIFATGSRGGMVCVVVALVSTALQKPRQAAGLMILGSAIGFGAWAFTPESLQQRLSGLLPEAGTTFRSMTGEAGDTPEFGSSSVYDRWIVARYAVQNLVPQAGLLGLGTGFKKLGTIDNFYLMEWISHGLIGLTLWMIFQTNIMVGCWRRSRIKGDAVEKGVAAGAVSAMLIMSASGFQGDSFFLIRPMETLSLMLGLVVARKGLKE